MFRKNVRKLFPLMLVIGCLILSSCNFGGGLGGNGENEENLIYNSNSELYVVQGDGVSDEATYDLIEEISAIRKYPQFSFAESPVQAHEIVIGDTDRQISKDARMLLERITHNVDTEESYLFYSDGSSLAIVFTDETALEVAIDRFASAYVKDKLVLAPGKVEERTFDAYAYLFERDVKKQNDQWHTVQSSLSDYENSEEIFVALRQLYEVYDASMLSWLANLYDPSICVCYGIDKKDVCEHTKYCGWGGFYYSNSARDTFGYLPDLESTNQAGNILSHVGLGGIGTLDEDILYDIGGFILSLQEENGYFYHPQWGVEMTNKLASRRNRDLTWATGLLSGLGLQPIYNTPNGVTGSGASLPPVRLTSSVRFSDVVFAAATLASDEAVTPYLENKESFEEYLDSLDLLTRSYHLGNNFSAMVPVIKERDRELQAEGADYSLAEILGEWFDCNMIASVGHWNGVIDKETGEIVPVSNYYAVNGIMKISAAYNLLERLYPNADKAVVAVIDAISSDEEIGQIVDVYNTWFAIGELRSNIRKYSKDYSLVDDINSALIANAPDFIKASMEKLSVFLKIDGSFSYNPRGVGSGTSQGAPAAVPQSNEGDVNATNIAVSTKNHIFSVLGLPRVEIFGDAEKYTFKKTIKELSSIRKDGVGASIVIGEPYDFDYFDLGELDKSDKFLKPETVMSGSIAVTRDPRDGYDGNVLTITSPTGSSEELKSYLVSTNDYTGNAIVLETDMCIEKSRYNLTMQVRVESIYFFTLSCKGGKVILSDTNNFNVKNELGVVGNVGEWFHLRVVIHLGDKDTFRVVVYTDTDLSDGTEPLPIAVSNNYRVYNKEKPDVVGDKFNYTKFTVLSSEDTVIHLDNFHHYKCKEDYSPLNTEEHGLSFNIEDHLTPPEREEE